MKHTPAPWTIEMSTNAPSPYRVMAHGMRNPIASIHARRDGLPDDEAASNARLIAAAPDLLEALIDIIATYPEARSEMVVAAIEKATGE